jgi:hypothetical protein
MRIAVLLSLFLSISAVLFGQSNYASVSGKVSDSASLPIAHATVRLKSASNGAVRSVSTDASGLFYAPALLPDDYELTTIASGFAPVAQRLHVEVGEKPQWTFP